MSENFIPTEKQIEKFFKTWGQTDEELKTNLGYDINDDVDDNLMDCYYWKSTINEWLPKNSILYTSRDKKINDYIRLNII